MTRTKALIIALVAVSAIGAAVASSASARLLGRCVEQKGTGKFSDSSCQTEESAKKGNFEIVAPTKTGFKTESGVSILRGAGTEVECKTDTGSGILSGVDAQKGVVVTFENCVVKAGGEECPIANIKTNPLKGENGEVKAAQAASEMGTLFTPEEPKKGFATIPGSKCAPETLVTGTIAGEATAVINSAKGTVVFALTAAKAQKIKEITTLVGLVKPALTAFALPATEETIEKVTYEEALTLSGGKI